MTGFRARPGFAVFAAFVVLLCLGLGFWQIQRLHWKEGLIAARAAAVAGVPAALPATATAARDMEFHRVAAEGVYLNDEELFVNATSARGDAGFHVLTPLRRADGHIVFVNRGFVPTDRRNPASRPAGEIAGSTRVVGLLRLAWATKPGWFLPDNRPDQNYWFWIDLPAMAAADHLGDVAPFYIDADATPNPGGLPRGGTTRLALPNNHLQYAITWFALAAAIVVIYVVSQSRNRPPP